MSLLSGAAASAGASCEDAGAHVGRCALAPEARGRTGADAARSTAAATERSATPATTKVRGHEIVSTSSRSYLIYSSSTRHRLSLFHRVRALGALVGCRFRH